MCLVWRCRLVAFILFVFLVLCDVLRSDAKPIGKVYPRGNHWAVGHLMGRKSTDEQENRLEEPPVTYVHPNTKLMLERNIRRNLLELLKRLSSGRQVEWVKMDTKAGSALQQIPVGRHPSHEEQTRERHERLVEDFLQAFRLEDEYKS